MTPKSFLMTRFNQIIKENFQGKENLNRLARELDINPKTLNSWLGGVNPKLTEVNIQAIERIAEYIGLSFSELLLGVSKNKRETVSSLKFKDDGKTYFIKIEKENIS